MKSYKKIMPIFLTVLLIASVLYAFQGKADRQNLYYTALEEARALADKGVVADAINQYKAALAINPSLPVYLEAGEVYLTHRESKNAKSWYNSVLLAEYPENAETYLYGMRTYALDKNYSEIFSIYDAYQKRELFLQNVEDFMENYLYVYSLTGIYQDAGVFSTSAGLAAVKYDGHWGYIDAAGKRHIRYLYDSADIFNGFAPVVDQQGRALLVDSFGNERINENFILDTDPDFGRVVRFQGIYRNLILAYNGSVWNYYDVNTYEKKFGGYSDALPAANGVGAVRMDGGKWALISSDGTLLTDYIYDEVLADGKSVSSRDDVLIAKLNDQYIQIDASGNQISSSAYTHVKAYNDTSYAAVEKNGKWIYLDHAGNEYDLGAFEDAESFSNGLAAVKIDGKWGYIDLSGTLVIENIFYGAGPFNQTGAAFVERASGEWTLLNLYRYNH